MTAAEVPGAATDPPYATRRGAGGINPILARHPRGAPHMADGDTRTKVGHTGVGIGTSRLAGTDVGAGPYAVTADSTPVLCPAGQVTKIRRQIVMALTIQAVEAMTPARRSGVNASRVRGALPGGFAQSRILDLHGQRLPDGDFRPGFRLRPQRGDLPPHRRWAANRTRPCSPPRTPTSGGAA